MNRYLYYPGCSAESSARAYATSLETVCKILGLDLSEIHDWNCCGATEYLGINVTAAYSLIGRNLALAQLQVEDTSGTGKDTVVAPCSACYLNLAKADHFMMERPRLGENVNTALAAGGLHYNPGKLAVRHLLDVMLNDFGIEAIKAKVVRPLTGLRVAPYLGCMVPRPDYEHRWSNPEYPTELDRLLKALGAEVVDYPLKTECCGGHMTQISPAGAFELIRRLLYDAELYQADMMVALCPMCQMNLDAYQGETNQYFHTKFHMPVIFFTQLMGLAFGLEPKAMGFGSELVSAAAALMKIGVEPPPPDEEPAKKPRKVKKEGLPMPQMPNGGSKKGQEETL